MIKLQLFNGRYGWLIEGSFAEVRQLISAWNFASFLTPDMASKNDARHGIELS